MTVWTKRLRHRSTSFSLVCFRTPARSVCSSPPRTAAENGRCSTRAISTTTRSGRQTSGRSCSPRIAKVRRICIGSVRTGHRRNGLRTDPSYDDQANFLTRRQATRLREFTQWRLCASLDAGSRVETRQGADVWHWRWRLPSIMVARRPLDRVRIGSRKLAAVCAWTLGTSAAGRPVSDSSRRHGREAHHRTRRVLREPEMGAGQPPCHRVLHDRGTNARQPAAEP